MAWAACTGNIGDDGASSAAPGDSPTDPSDGPGDDDEVDPNTLDQDRLFTCEGTEINASPAMLRRIDRREWHRINGWASSRTANNPFDAGPTHQYSTFSGGEAFDATTLSAYLDVLDGAAGRWLSRNKYAVGSSPVNEHDAFRCFMDEADPTTTCRDDFAGYLLERGVLFRPPTHDESSSLRTIIDAMLADEAQASLTREETFKKVLSAAWMKSGALLRSDMGRGETADDGRRRLDAWELAHAVGYALDGRAPGTMAVRFKDGSSRSNKFTTGSGGLEGHLPALFDAAEDGSIFDQQTLEELVTIYISGEDRFRDDLGGEGYNYFEGDDESVRGQYWMANGVRDFFREWLGYIAINTNPSPQEVTATSAWEGDSVASGSYNNIRQRGVGRESELVDQMDDMIARVVALDEQVLVELLTTRTYFVPATAGYPESNISKRTAKMSYVYDVTDPVQRTQADRWRDMPPTERAGVLTHPAWLTAHGLALDNDPSLVERGKWIRENLLCSPVPDLPITVDAQFDPETDHQSARQRATEQLDNRTECAACHQLMNPLGYPFELYNHTGFLRVDDHGSSPDGSSELKNMPDESLDGPVSGPTELAERLAQSNYVKRCFIRQTFRYFAGRSEAYEDACALEQMERAYDESTGSFTALLVALFNSETFQYRVDAYEEP